MQKFHLPEKAFRPTRRIKESVARRKKRKEQTKNNKNRYCAFF